MTANKGACASAILTFVVSSVAVLGAVTLPFSSLIIAEGTEKEFLIATSRTS